MPDGSALHRAMRSDERQWTVADAVAWQTLGELRRANMYHRAALKIRPEKDRFVWPQTPWVDSDNASSERVGSVAPADQSAAVAYLIGLSAPPS